MDNQRKQKRIARVAAVCLIAGALLGCSQDKTVVENSSDGASSQSGAPVFQGTAYPETTTQLTVDILSAEDAAALAAFPNLEKVNAIHCTDYDSILALLQQKPELDITYAVTIGGREYRSSSNYARIPDPDFEEVIEKLKYLPNVDTVLFPGMTLTDAQLSKLEAAYPDIQWNYDTEYQGLSFNTDTAYLNLTGLGYEKPEDAEEIISRLPNLKTVDLSGYGFTNEQMAALGQRYGDIEFVWDMMIGNTSVRTDAVEIDISGNRMTPADIEALLPYFTRLEKVIMSHCGISNEDMDALNKRYDDIRFVWTVYAGGYPSRTDIKYFMPTKVGKRVDDYSLGDLKYCTDLVAIDLGHHSVSQCEWVRDLKNLEYFLCADTQLMSIEPLSGLPKLKYVEIFQTYVMDFTPLLTLPALEDLNVCWTYGKPEVVAQLTGLRRLWWSGKWHQKEELDLMTGNLTDCTFNFYDGWATGSGWRQHANYYKMREIFGMFIMY